MEHRAKRRTKTKLFASPKNWTDAIMPLIILNNILGIRAFEYPRHRPRRIISLLYIIILYGMYISGSLDIESEYFAGPLLKLEYVLYKLISYITICSVTIKLFLGWWYAKKFKACQKKIVEIDETLRQLGSTISYGKIYFTIIGTIVVWVIITCITSIIAYLYLEIRSELSSRLYMIIGYTYSLTVNAIIVFEFYIFVKCLQMRFELVNQLLCESSTMSSLSQVKLGIFEMKDYADVMKVEQCKNNLITKALLQWCQRVQSRINISLLEKKNSVKPQSHLPSQLQKQFEGELRSQSQRYVVMTKCEKRIHMLQTIKQVHLELCKVSKIVCNILSIQTAWEIAMTIILLTGSLYNLYLRYVVKRHYSNYLIQESILSVVLIILYVSKIIFLCRACKRTAYEGNKTIEIIHAIYSCGASHDMQDVIQQFGVQIMQSPVAFCAFGISLDNQVLSLTLKTVTIYLVIMIQVSNSLESNKSILHPDH